MILVPESRTAECISRISAGKCEGAAKWIPLPPSGSAAAPVPKPAKGDSVHDSAVSSLSTCSIDSSNIAIEVFHHSETGAFYGTYARRLIDPNAANQRVDIANWTNVSCAIDGQNEQTSASKWQELSRQ
jgi:hypothetical protein